MDSGIKKKKDEFGINAGKQISMKGRRTPGSSFPERESRVKTMVQPSTTPGLGKGIMETGRLSHKETPAPEGRTKAVNESYASKREEWKAPTVPYAAGLQAGLGSVEKKSADKMTLPKAVWDSGATTPYIAGRDEGKTGFPYGAGLQAGIKPESPTLPEDSGESGSWQKWKAPSRTSIAVREELEPLEDYYEKLLREAETWESQAIIQATLEEMSQWEKKAKDSRQEAALLEPRLEALQKEWESAMNWEWETQKKQSGYRDATLWDLTAGSVKRGYDNAQYGIESYKDMMGDEDNRKAEYEEKLAGEEYRFIPEKWWQQGISGGMEMLGQQLRQWTDPDTLAMGATAAGGAALLGNAGPQALIPEEVVTVPGAFLAGTRLGASKSNYEIEAGLAYNEMLEKGVSEGTARIIAQGVGGLNAALEFVQLDELVKSFRVLKDSGVGQSMLEKIAGEILFRGGEVSREVLQEIAQESVTVAGVQAGSKLDTGEWAYDAGEVTDRLAETGVSSALSFGTMAVPGAVMNVTAKPSIVSDQVALDMARDRQQVDFLTRKGGLKLTKDMTQGEKIAAVRAAVERIAGVKKDTSQGEAGRPRITMAEFTDPSAPIWTNVEYGDTESQAKITQNVHQEMVEAGRVVQVNQDTRDLVARSYPDLRGMKKKERLPILRMKMLELKESLRNFLSGYKEDNVEFEVKGKVLEARLYDTGIREVLDKITQDKAAMLYTSGEIFQNAQYLYSTQDYDGDPNVYRWNYFYVPVQIGEDIIGVRIAVRDMVWQPGVKGGSQIYNWGIKRDITVDGDGRGEILRDSDDVS